MQQFLRVYFRACFIGLLAFLLFDHPVAHYFLPSLLVLGIVLLLGRFLYVTWEWWQADKDSPKRFNYPYKVLFYGTSSGILLGILSLILLI